jgi:catechol 2,3-dioxygenase-like lactoylglutathione lyase family enzyme
MAGSNEVIGGGGFHHVALRVMNFEASIKFYTEVLGMNIVFDGPHPWEPAIVDHICLLDAGDGNCIEIFTGGKQDIVEFDQYRAGAYFHIALRSNNVDAVVERARNAGTKILVEPLDVKLEAYNGDVKMGRVAFILGPDGEQIEFFQE